MVRRSNRRTFKKSRKSFPKHSRKSMKSSHSKKTRRHHKTSRRLRHKGGSGFSADHHAIAMVGDATMQLNNSMASAYN